MKVTIPTLVAIAIILGFIFFPAHVSSLKSTETATSTAPTLTHEQEVWQYALEWCESQGKASAINPKDRDNTPSYGAYQFKPSTLTYFAKLYGIATSTEGVMDPSVQTKIVEQMILHRADIDWHQQFPDCVRKLGLPPLPHSPTAP